MKALAQKDLAATSDLTTLVSIGDGWSEIAEREKVVIRKRNAELHSRGFYEAALPLATGLIRTKIERRLQSMDLPVPREGDPK
jgi:hypothetical protein